MRLGRIMKSKILIFGFFVLFFSGFASAQIREPADSPKLSNYCTDSANSTKQVCQWVDDAARTCSALLTEWECEGEITLTEFCTLAEFNGDSTTPSRPVCIELEKQQALCSALQTVQECRATLVEASAASGTENKPKGDNGWISTLEKVWGVFFAAALAFMTLWARVKLEFKRLKQKYDEVFGKYKTRNIDPTPDIREAEFLSQGINVVLIGTGGAGKTSIIRALTAIGAAEPIQATAGMDLYTLVQEVHSQREGSTNVFKRSTRIYIQDHKGQETLRAFANNRALQERENFVPNTMFVFVMDLFSPTDETPPYIRPNANRVNEQVQYFSNPETLQFIRDMTTEVNRTSVVLFINKVDMILPLSIAKLSEIKTRYKPLYDAIRGAFNGYAPYQILGSAAEGWGVSGVNPADPMRDRTLLEIIIGEAGPMSPREISSNDG